MKEEWRDITGYEGHYQVSDLGRVRSLDRVVFDKVRKLQRRLKGKTLSPGRSGQRLSYLFVNLSKGNQKRGFTIHTLVAQAFLGPRPEGLQVLHGLEGSLVNTPANLRYGTHLENGQDMIRDGTSTNKPVRRSDGKEFTGATEAERLTGVNRANISSACNKYVRPNGYPVLTAGGFRWEFA